MTPKLIGYLCKSGAYTFYESGHAVLRTLPRDFQALPVAHVSQIGIAEIAKAFRLGAAGVLMLGCEICSAPTQRTTLDRRHTEMMRELAQWGVTAERLVFASCSAREPLLFFEMVTQTLVTVVRMPPLLLPHTIDATIQHCG